MSIDHISINVTDFAVSKAFFAAALAPLDIVPAMEAGQSCGFGRDGQLDFWIASGERHVPLHIAFTAQDRAQVRAFHRAALEAGGRDNGGPGIRANYHPDYYAAFVYGPDGHNIEAVCHAPPA